jgi:hypothetical protein
MIYPRVALTLLLSSGLFNGATAQEITEDSFFYGNSPPVYPSRGFFAPMHYPVLTSVLM